MKLATFITGDRPELGVVSGDLIIPLNRGPSDLPADMIGLIRAWPAQAGPPPVCEMFWTGETPGGSPRGLQLSAFDEAGRVLLRRTFDPWSEQSRPSPELSHG